MAPASALGLPTFCCGASAAAAAGGAALFQREALLEPRLAVKRATQSCAFAARICEALQALSGVEPATEPSTGGLLAMYG